MDDTTAQATPQLLTDIQFNVARKGYDPSEVDAFLERLSAAVTVMQDRLRQSAAEAESAGRRAAEAERESAALRARIAELESGVVFTPVTAETSPEVEAEQAASVLAMARRTADAVVNDARATAATMLTEAEAEAAAEASGVERRLPRRRKKGRIVNGNGAKEPRRAERREFADVCKRRRLQRR